MHAMTGGDDAWVEGVVTRIRASSEAGSRKGHDDVRTGPNTYLDDTRGKIVIYSWRMATRGRTRIHVNFYHKETHAQIPVIMVDKLP
jgi:hypothetical protein